MQQRVTTLIGAFAVGFAIWIAFHNFHMPKAIGRPLPSTGSSALDGGGYLYALGDAGATSDEGGVLAWHDLTADMRIDAGGGTTMSDGTPVPPLPFTSPRQIRFGVVLVTYTGAQPGPSAARPSARSRVEARTLADRLLATAQQDFHAAVQQGDSGSADDIGYLKLGILEPAPEYVLFTLPVDGVGGPVDTPRGYWIVKRLE